MELATSLFSYPHWCCPLTLDGPTPLFPPLLLVTTLASSRGSPPLSQQGSKPMKPLHEVAIQLEGVPSIFFVSPFCPYSP